MKIHKNFLKVCGLVMILTAILAVMIVGCSQNDAQTTQTPEYPSDEQIKKNVVDHLTWDNQIDASKILVEVDNREVILKGTVTTINQRLQAQIDAEDIEGVTHVIMN